TAARKKNRLWRRCRNRCANRANSPGGQRVPRGKGFLSPRDGAGIKDSWLRKLSDGSNLFSVSYFAGCSSVSCFTVEAFSVGASGQNDVPQAVEPARGLPRPDAPSPRW